MKQKTYVRVAAITVLGIFAATFGGDHAVQAEPEPNVKSFCEYGTAWAPEFGAAGATWFQTWGGEAFDCEVCTAEPNFGLFGDDIEGQLITTTTGAPDFSLGDLIIQVPFSGLVENGQGLRFTAYKKNGKIDGEIRADVIGVFVADLNANRAVVTDDTITVEFGTLASIPVGMSLPPDALVTVREKSGRFQSVHQSEDWEWFVSGTITIARVVSLPVQTNILAALQNADLILYAEEEIVLTGSYYGASPLAKEK